jgi:hypothetical protein
MYPTLLADEINLDSPQEQKAMMLRTCQNLRSAGTSGATLLLLGVPPDTTNRRGGDEDAEILLNSRSGRIHLFPGSTQTDEVAFHNFQARGGFLVSACRNGNGVYHVEVQARRDCQCRLMNPWPGQPVIVREVGKTESVPFNFDQSNGEGLTFPAQSGRRYSIKTNSV